MRKPKIPTPPDSPECMQDRMNNTIISCVPKIAIDDKDDEHQTGLYSSDDSGRGTVDDSSDLSEDNLGDKHEYFTQFKTERKDRLRKLMKESMTKKLEILKLEKYCLSKRILKNDGDVKEIAVEMSKVGTNSEMSRLEDYVRDSEKITLLLHSLAKRLALLEQCPGAGIGEENLLRKQEHLLKQFEEAKDIADGMDKRLVNVLQTVEKHLGKETRRRLQGLIEMKVKLLLAIKEVNKVFQMEQEMGKCFYG